MISEIMKKIKNFFYYERVVLYGYDLTQTHDFEIETEMILCPSTMEDVGQLYNDEKNTDLTSIKWDIWKDKVSKGLWKGFLVKDDDSIVAQAFYSIEDIFFAGTKKVRMLLPANSAYGFKLFARPDYRGKRLGQAVTSYRLNCAKRDGINQFYTIIYAKNKISRHNEEKIGGYLVGSVIFLKCRFFNKVFLTPGIRKDGLKITSLTDI